MKTGWLVYDRRDYEINTVFTAHMRQAGEALDVALRVVLTEDFEEAIQSPPDFAVSRQRNPKLSVRLESLGVPVFNSSKVCEICNDKRNTHRFLDGLPLMKTRFLEPYEAYAPAAGDFPIVVKPAFGHGGDHVTLVENQTQLASALNSIYPLPALAQELASEAGRDLRVYVLFGQILAGVMRTAKHGIVSNFKQGGSVALHAVSAEERSLAERVIKRFEDAGAPLCFAGIDLIYHRGQPVVNEVEDVVGSRMLYQVGGPDCIALYIRGIAVRLSHDNSGKV
jgi:gamma-F420-2:alpha-L-glutamate ligase